MKKNELQPLSYNIHKNRRCIVVLSVNVKSRKFKKGDIEHLHNSGVGKGFLDMTQKTNTIKGNTDKLSFTKAKNCSFLTEIVIKTNRQAKNLRERNL